MRRKKIEPGNVRTIILVAMFILTFTACQEDPELRSEVFQVPATATFLRSDGSDSPSDPLIIELDEIGIAPGTRLRMRTLGEFINSPSGARRNDAIGVFSSSMQLLGISERNRVVDAIDAGEDRVTDNTFENNHITDIDEDFRIDEERMEIVVPTNAQYLFVGNADSKQADNSETSQGFRVEISY